MKNIIVIGLVSLVLFGVSAGLSVWLQSNAKTPDTGHGDDKKKKAGDEHGDAKEKGHGEGKEPAADPHAKPADPKPAAIPKEGPDRTEYRRLQMEVVATDLNGQMQDYDKLLKKVAVEMKGLTDRQKELDAQAEDVKQADARVNKTTADLKKTQLDIDAAEKANITRIAGLVDQMPAEAAAAVIQQLADTGKTDTAVKVLAQMKERTAAKVMAAIADPSLPPTLIEKMRTIKRAATPEVP